MHFKPYFHTSFGKKKHIRQQILRALKKSKSQKSLNPCFLVVLLRILAVKIPRLILFGVGKWPNLGVGEWPFLGVGKWPASWPTAWSIKESRWSASWYSADFSDTLCYILYVYFPPLGGRALCRLSRPAAIFRIANQMQPKSLPPLRLRNVLFLYVLYSW